MVFQGGVGSSVKVVGAGGPRHGHSHSEAGSQVAGSCKCGAKRSMLSSWVWGTVFLFDVMASDGDRTQRDTH